jgi:hypothetical protein
MLQQYKEALLRVTPDSASLYSMFRKCPDRLINFRDVPDEQLESIKCPVLLVNGDEDVPTSKHVVAVSRTIPNCRLAIIPGGRGEYLGEILTLKSIQGEFPILPDSPELYAMKHIAHEDTDVCRTAE